ncbi:MAG: hypothetical protein V8S74_00205 [Lachnospirales bacterium]
MRSIQEKLVKSTLIPVALLGMALIVITPFLLIFLLWQQVNHKAYLASQAVSVPLKEYIEGMKQLQSDPKLISFLTSGEHSIEAYRSNFINSAMNNLYLPISSWKMNSTAPRRCRRPAPTVCFPPFGRRSAAVQKLSAAPAR